MQGAFCKPTRQAAPGTRCLTERMIREESAYLNTFDSAIVFSEVDRRALQEFSPALEVAVSPFPSPEEPASALLPFSEATGHFVLVASESHRPNVDGFCWFMKNVWPAIKRRLQGTTIEVIGKWSQSARETCRITKTFALLVLFPEPGKALQRKIMVVPVWVGSGIRTKILAAWGECSVVTTSVGVEGLPGTSGEHFVVADEASGFSDACVELSGDVVKLNRIAANGLHLVQEHYSLAAVRKTRLSVYEELLAAGLRSSSQQAPTAN